ncbi:MAG: L-ribulose-5-phosphate 4-epimerase [Candidatus Fervidibacter sp.]|uniref:L-ribulose-5-phosphate 4-epimerase n=1 Tax=Candidatus Fervidibacter sp. TaxID=3100871 RepID=UPI00404BA377
MRFKELRELVCLANKKLGESGLVILTWGNVSGVDREKGVMAIKPSGVEYKQLAPENIVVLSLETGEVVEGELRPSSDTPTHLLLYREFESIGGVVHTHSPYATAWAQAGKEIPCLGTTHADYFYGTIPMTRLLTEEEISENYELNTGKVIVECFRERNLNPTQMPAVLIPHHGVFTWGDDPLKALENAIVLEEVAKLSLYTYSIAPNVSPIPKPILDKHFFRKHGPTAYYGQKRQNF